MSDVSFEPLPRDEVIKAVERRSPRRVPMVLCRWWGEGLREEYGDRLQSLERYPEDAVMLGLHPVDLSTMKLSWYDHEAAKRGARDAGGVLHDWGRLDEFIEHFPDPETMDVEWLRETADRAVADDRYVLMAFWNFFFERPWGFRGMENLLTDYYLEPDNVHRLHEALCRQYEALLRRAAREFRIDGFFTSDDLGHQRQLMMKPDHFREFIKPYYARIGAVCRELGLHFWLHSCGNNFEIMDDLIETGVTVFHPVQKHTMDERETASRFGRRMTFHAGFDVQHTLREGTSDDVRREVRFLVDTFDGPDGGMILAAGNGIVGGTPFENIEAFLDECVRYGTKHRSGCDASSRRVT